MPSTTISGGNTTVVIRGGNTQRIVQDRRTAALIKDGATVVKTTGGIGVQGSPGIKGDPGAGASFVVTALTNMTYPCVVAIVDGVAHLADPMSDADMTSQLAVTTQGVLAGAPVVVTTAGQMTESAWNWANGRIFLGTSGGQLTQTLGATGAVMEVARAMNATTIEIGIQPALLR